MKEKIPLEKIPRFTKETILRHILEILHFRKGEDKNGSNSEESNN